MKRFSTYFALCFAILFSALSLHAQTPVKRVMLEQFTGAWCGWCVDGSVVMDELIKEYPENVIGVKVHQGDAMEIPKLFDSIKAIVPFYPSGSIDRVSFPGEQTVGTSRENWKEYVLKQMTKPCDVDVKVINVSFDKATRTLTAEVEATFVKSMSGDLRLNLMVVEDEVTGSGTGYDQSNYISNNASFKGHPYYDLPAKIEGYHHKSVVRAYPGGVWGVKNSIPAITSTGTYKASFTYTVPQEYDAGNILLIGTVQKYGSAMAAREILNAHQVGLLKAPAIMESSLSGQFQQVQSLDNREASLTIKNKNATPVTVTYEIDQKASTIPDGWKATTDKVSSTLEPGTDEVVKVRISSNDKPGFAKVVVNAIVKGENVFTKSIKSVVYSLSNSIQHAVYGSHVRMNELYASHMETIKPSTTAALPMDADVLSGFPPTMFDMAIIAVDHENAGMIANNSVFINAIASMLQNGKKVFLASESELSTIMKMDNPIISALFNSTLGISVKAGSPVKRFDQDVNSGDILMAYPIALKGKDGDFLSRNINTTLNKYFEDPVLTPFTRYTDVLSINQGSSAIPVFTFDEKADDIAAIRWENGDARLVIFGFGLDGMDDKTTLSTIMTRTYNWLLRGASSIEEQESASMSLAAQPNPASGMMHVQYTIKGNQEHTITLRVIDILGNEVYSSGLLKSAPGNHSYALDAASFPIGTYRLVLKGADENAVQIPLMIIR